MLEYSSPVLSEVEASQTRKLEVVPSTREIRRNKPPVYVLDSTVYSSTSCSDFYERRAKALAEEREDLVHQRIVNIIRRARATKDANSLTINTPPKTSFWRRLYYPRQAVPFQELREQPSIFQSAVRYSKSFIPAGIALSGPIATLFR